MPSRHPRLGHHGRSEPTGPTRAPVAADHRSGAEEDALRGNLLRRALPPALPIPIDGCQRSAPAKPAWGSRMIVPSRPDASSPGPRDPDPSSPTVGSWRSADLVAADICVSCHRISSATAAEGSGPAGPAALAAYAATPRACAPMWAMAAACPAAFASAAADGLASSRAAAPPTKRAGSLLRHRVRRGKRPACGRWHRVDGYHLELPLRTATAHALRSPPPTRRRSACRLR